MNFDEVLKEESEDNPLKEAVILDLKGFTHEEILGYLKNVCEHGGVSGSIPSLIYYKDTNAFYDEYEEEIEELVYELQENGGYKNRLEFLGSLNGAENVCSIEQEKNLLAWLSYEETARIILERLEEYI